MSRLALAAVVLLAGCSFPEPEILDSPVDSATGDTSSVDTSVVTETGADTKMDPDTSIPDETSVDSGSDTTVVADGDATVVSDGDATVVSDGDATVVTDGDAATADTKDTAVADTKSDTFTCIGSDPICDCDGDGDKKPGPPCDGMDCDDGDPRRNSLVSAFQGHSLDGVTHGGDWNCAGGVEREFGNGPTNCAGLALGPCAGTQGWKNANPTCGTMQPFAKCAVSGGVFCAEASATSTLVKCK